MTNLQFEICDYNNPIHKSAFTGLLNHYMSDPMGDYPELSEKKQHSLIELLSNHSNSFILLMKNNEEYIGLATCFELISTFQVKPYIYIHDVVIHSSQRGKGYGKMLMEKISEIAEEKKCCKITLEVREDNNSALKLYKDLGYKDCDPVMYFWTKKLK